MKSGDWALVKFEDGIFQPTKLPKKHQKAKIGSTILCSWKGGGKYFAKILLVGSEDKVKKQYEYTNTCDDYNLQNPSNQAGETSQTEVAPTGSKSPTTDGKITFEQSVLVKRTVPSAGVHVDNSNQYSFHKSAQIVWHNPTSENQSSTSSAAGIMPLSDHNTWQTPTNENPSNSSTGILAAGIMTSDGVVDIAFNQTGCLSSEQTSLQNPTKDRDQTYFSLTENIPSTSEVQCAKKRRGTRCRYRESNENEGDFSTFDIDNFESSGSATSLEESIDLLSNSANECTEQSDTSSDASDNDSDDANYQPSVSSSSEDAVKEINEECEPKGSKKKTNQKSFEESVRMSILDKVGESIDLLSTQNTTSRHSQLNEECKYASVEVQKSQNTPHCRKWDKKQACVYCNKLFSKLPKHLFARHKDETAVMEGMLLPKKSMERKVKLAKLRNAGNYSHNTEVIKTGKGKIIPHNRPAVDKSADRYYPCEHCLGFFIKEDLWRHSKKCVGKPKGNAETKGRTRKQCFSATLLPLPSTCSQGLHENVISKMNTDPITLVVKNDPLILSLGSRLYQKHGSERHLDTYISQKMREIGRLLLNARKVSKNLQTLKDCINVKMFPDVITAAKLTAGFDEETHIWKKPSLALKLGHSLNMCASLVKSEALMTENQDDVQRAEKFKVLYEMNWKTEVSSHALTTMSRKRWNNQQVLPLNEDIQKVNHYLQNQLDMRLKGMEKSPSVDGWVALAKVTLAIIILFNRRRGGEVSRLEVETYKTRDTRSSPEEIINSLTKFEKHLVESLTVIETRGKRGRKVVILLRPEMKQAVEIIIANRELAGVVSENKYVFARAKFGSLENMRGPDVLREVVRDCGVKNQKAITSTCLRKHIATMSQLFNLKENEMDNLASFLGHDIAVHRNFYRLPENILIMSKVGKLLMAADEGNLHKFKGKSLEEIDVNEDIGEEEVGSSDDELDEENCCQMQLAPSNLNEVSVENTLKRKHQRTTNSQSMRSSSNSHNDIVTNGKKRKRQKQVNSDYSSEDDVDDACRKQTKSKRIAWSEQEKTAVELHLPANKYLALKTLPGKLDCTKCIENAGGVLSNRTWQQVKFFIHNQLQKQKRQ